MHAQQLAEDRLRVTADDMPGCAMLRSRIDGFEFSPYVIRTRVLGPLRLRPSHYDSVRLEADDTMTDTIELRFLGVVVGRITVRLKRIPSLRTTRSCRDAAGDRL